MAVAAWSRHSSSTKPLADLGAAPFEEAAEAVRDADVVISMLPTAATTIEIMIDGQVLRAMRPGAVWAQMATIGVGPTDQMAAVSRAERADVTFVDAPVSGSRTPAEHGQLLILASGPPDAERLLGPVFAALGRETLWLGPAGAGSRMKLVLNTWLAFQTEGAAEATALAARLGVPASSLHRALEGNPLASPYALAKLDRMVDEDYHPDFALDLALKDLDLVATTAGANVAPIAAAIAGRWRDLVGSGSSGLDVSAARRGLA
jgi:3-hydroxyisobutyrate dehydrogenase